MSCSLPATAAAAAATPSLVTVTTAAALSAVNPFPAAMTVMLVKVAATVASLAFIT